MPWHRWKQKSASANKRGFALVTVLWTVSLLAVLTGSYVANRHDDLLLARNIEQQTRARLVADGVIFHLVGQMIGREVAEWPALATPGYTYEVAGDRAKVTIINEGAKLSLNAIKEDQLTTLLTQVGVDGGEAAQLAAAVVDWRDRDTVPRPNGAEAPAYAAQGLLRGPANRPFYDFAELGTVIGMTLDYMQRLHPYLSVFGRGRRVDGFGRENNQDALNQAAPVTLRADVIVDGTRFIREATVWIFPFAEQPYRVLRWKRIYPFAAS